MNEWVGVIERSRRPSDVAVSYGMYRESYASAFAQWNEDRTDERARRIYQTLHEQAEPALLAVYHRMQELCPDAEQ